MSEPRRHHIVPVHYLTRFANESGCVQVIDRRLDNRSFAASVNDIPVARDFYTVETSDGRAQDVEKFLSVLEGGGRESGAWLTFMWSAAGWRAAYPKRPRG